jgi:FtsZ-binding cell division protein ZapB
LLACLNANNKKEEIMDRNYNAYNPEIVDSLIQVDDLIDKTELEIKELKKQRNTIQNDPQKLKETNARIQREETDLKRYIKERKDIVKSND